MIDTLPPAPKFDGTQPCASVDPDLWFPKQGESSGVAKTICAACPFVEPCLEWGVQHERFGVWGGMSAPQLALIRKQRRVVLDALDAPAQPHDETTHGTYGGIRWHQRHATRMCGACRVFEQDRPSRRAR